jgi:hypothetical protein
MKKCIKPCWPELPRTNHACLPKLKSVSWHSPFKGTVQLLYIRSTWEWTSCLGLGIYIFFISSILVATQKFVCRIFIQKNVKLLTLIIKHFNLNCSLIIQFLEILPKTYKNEFEKIMNLAWTLAEKPAALNVQVRFRGGQIETRYSAKKFPLWH